MNICECGEPTHGSKCDKCREELKRHKAQREREWKKLPYYLVTDETWTKLHRKRRDKSRKMNREIEGVFPN